MAALVIDRDIERELIAERRRTGADRYDEVWDGVYVMSPMADNEHQELVNGLSTVMTVVVAWPGRGKVFPGVNISDRDSDWKKNYRCPDVVVFLNDTKAVNRGSHWYGGPDLAVEIVSPSDRSRKKLVFYAKIGTRELLIVDRHPWALELYRLDDGELKLVATSTVDDGAVLRSDVVPLSFRLVAGDERPRIEIAHVAGDGHWMV
ncbi:MAG: Uma2 family endonuclease [Planctomycetaceae bacterium]